MKLDHPTLAYQNETRKRITVLKSMELLIDTSVDEMANTVSVSLRPNVSPVGSKSKS